MDRLLSITLGFQEQTSTTQPFVALHLAIMMRASTNHVTTPGGGPVTATLLGLVGNLTASSGNLAMYFDAVKKIEPVVVVQFTVCILVLE